MRKAVCSWSLRPENSAHLIDQLRLTGVTAVQLALDPLRRSEDLAAEMNLLQQSGVQVVSGMMEMVGEDYSTFSSIRETGGVRPDETWDENQRCAHENAVLARELGLHLVTFHAGFIPHDSSDPERNRMLDRLNVIVDIFAEMDCQVALETGQETAQTLVEVLEEIHRPELGVNFDPANMILYGMGDPVTSLDSLAPWVKQIHIKDACKSDDPGEWGSEVPVGTGEVNWGEFFAVVRERQLDVDLVIEREAGDDRVGDVKIASDRLNEWLGI